MIITIDEVKLVFDNLLSGNITREDADRWAYSIIKLSEGNEISYSPIEAKEKIWEALKYLYGVDLRDSPSDYLHTLEDIEEASKIFFNS